MVAASLLLGLPPQTTGRDETNRAEQFSQLAVCFCVQYHTLLYWGGSLTGLVDFVRDAAYRGGQGAAGRAARAWMPGGETRPHVQRSLVDPLRGKRITPSPFADSLPVRNYYYYSCCNRLFSALLRGGGGGSCAENIIKIPTPIVCGQVISRTSAAQISSKVVPTPPPAL